MPIKILMPALSPTMEHGNLAKWIKKEGDKIEAGEVIAEIETDKATMEVEAVDEGTLAKIIVEEGASEVAVNSLIAVILEEGEDESALSDFLVSDNGAQNHDNIENDGNDTSSSAQESDASKQEPAADEVNAKDITSQTEQELASKTETNNSRIFASPLAKRLAKERNIDLSTITGSGPRGRIVKADLDNTKTSINENSEMVVPRSISPTTNKQEISRNNDDYKLVKNSTMRKVIAKRLTESKQNVPHFYLSVECSMDALLDARVQINSSVGDDKTKRISVNDFIILASARALQEVPEANASWSEDAIKLYNNVDVSVAVAIEGGLITPIVKNAEQKNIKAISSEMKDLVNRAKAGTLKPEEYQGGGFSISNLGMYGVKSFQAIVNPPQGCILAVGASNKRAVIVDDKFVVKTMMDVNLSCDHRVIDGAVGAMFLKAFKKYIEAPVSLLL